MLPTAFRSRVSPTVARHAGSCAVKSNLSPQVAVQPAIAVCIGAALTISLQAPASADVEKTVSYPRRNDSVRAARAGSEAKHPRPVGNHTRVLLDIADEGQLSTTCPEFSGLRKYICYGPCCGLPWGPGGPICLALAGTAFRYGMPYTIVGWVRSEDAELPGTIDTKTLAFSAALFLSAAPRTAEGFAFSFLFIVICLL